MNQQAGYYQQQQEASASAAAAAAAAAAASITSTPTPAADMEGMLANDSLLDPVLKVKELYNQLGASLKVAAIARLSYRSALISRSVY